MSEDRQRAAEVVEREAAHLRDLDQGYPANHFAWRIALDSAHRRGGTSLVEVGVGRGNGVAHVLAAGMRFGGVDHDAEAVVATREALADLGGDPSDVITADAEDATSLKHLPGAGEFDTLVALGIMPHVTDREHAVANMMSLVKPGGELFLEFRNSLFSLITFNRFTRDFIADDLLQDVSPAMRARVSDFVTQRIDTKRPPLPSSGHDARYDNPLAVPSWLQSLGFTETSIHPFHFHAAMPVLEAEDPQGFRDQSLALEDDASGWRGLFLCSAFLARIVRPVD